MNSTYKFSDIATQAQIINNQIVGMNNSITAAHLKTGGDISFVPGLIDHDVAQRALVNRIGKFYGKRSKYDGSGNLREPMKASRFQ